MAATGKESVGPGGPPTKARATGDA
ncbi:DUF6053 domain-containing protein [Lysobacter enzymogenes]